MNLNSDFYFFGDYAHSLDDKGRLALPSGIREELGRSERPELLFAKANGAAETSDTYLTLYPYEHWRKLMAAMEASITDTDRRNAALRAFTKDGRQLNLDKAGRVLISPDQRAAAGLSREVRILGLGSKIQIWDAAGHERKEAQDKAVLDEVTRTLGLNF